MSIFKKKKDEWESFDDVLFPKEKKTSLRIVGELFIEVVKVALISLAIIIPIRYFLIQPFYVKGASMEPNFYDHEYLIIDEISYGIKVPLKGERIAEFKEPARGDIVVFRYPLDPKQYYIKRIIALPGEKIKIRNNKVYIFNKDNPNGTILDESGYLDSKVPTSGDKEIILGPDEYFVMGDNRRASHDSRTFGPVPKENIVGQVVLRGWPFTRFDVFRQPDYNF